MPQFDVRYLIKIAKILISIGAPLLGNAGSATALDFFLPTADELSRTAPTRSELTRADVAGYLTPGDGAGGTFDWLPTSTAAADNVLVFRATSTVGRWVRRWSGGRISPEMAGARGDGRTDDGPAFARLVALSRVRGSFTIDLTAGRHYYIATTLDLSTGAPGLSIEGPGSPRTHTAPSIENSLIARIELEAATGATIKMGVGQSLHNVLVWRHGLIEAPTSLADVRTQVNVWFNENGTSHPLSVGVFAPFDDVTIEGTSVIGFHTGILASGQRFKIRHCYVDAAGYAVEVLGSRDTSIMDDIQTRALWSNIAQGRDALGDHSYRPGTAFYIHDGADGLQINSVMSIGWVNGIWLAGSPRGNDWLISLLQPNVETPPNDGHISAAIKTTGEVRRITILDPRIVSGGLVALDLGHTAPNRAAAANNNVTIIGGAIEMANPQGSPVILRTGSTGTIIGTTLNLTSGNAVGPLIIVEPNVGRWEFISPRLSGNIGHPWIRIDPSSQSNIRMLDVFSGFADQSMHLLPN
jgi:hypothetical protein